MNDGDAYNKGVIQKCLRTSLKEVVMSMMFTKTVSFLTVTQTFITSCTIPHSDNDNQDTCTNHVYLHLD